MTVRAEHLISCATGGGDNLMPITRIASSPPLPSIHLSVTGVATTTAYMLVDVSDTTNWKHTGTDHVHIDHLGMAIVPGTSFTGSVDIGFLTNVDATNGDFNELIGKEIGRAAAATFIDQNYHPHGLSAWTDEHFGPVTADSVLFQTDVALVGPDGNSFNSGSGDLVLLVTRGAGTIDVAVTLTYQGQA